MYPTWLKRPKDSHSSLVQPFSFETKVEYVDRFARHTDMAQLFPKLSQRFSMARQVFAARWKEALVTVSRVDGTQFFID